MESSFSPDTQEFQEPKKRSQFLVTLCVLSFIMCGITILSGVWNIIQSTPENMQQNIENLRAVNPVMADELENNWIEMQSNPFSAIMPYLSIVYTLLSFLGVLMMWNRKKNGFYIYAIAEILPYTSFLILGKNSLSMVSGASNASFAMITLVMMVAIDVVFVGLYAKSLKEME